MAELGIWSQCNGQVGAVACGVVQFSEVVGIHFLAAFALLTAFLFPGFYDVVGLINVAEFQQQLPQLFQSLFLWNIFQNIFCPVLGWDHRDQPLAVFITAGFAHDIANCVSVSKNRIGLCLRNILHQFWIDAFQTNIASALIQIHLILTFFPVFHFSHISIAAVFGSDFHIWFIQIVNDNIGCAQFIAFFCENRSKICAFDGSFHQYRLTFLNIQTNSGQCVGVFLFHFSKIHSKTSFQIDRGKVPILY